MALQDLVGAECGGSNPFMKFVQHFTEDKALGQERDRFVPEDYQEDGPSNYPTERDAYAFDDMQGELDAMGPDPSTPPVAQHIDDRLALEWASDFDAAVPTALTRQVGPMRADPRRWADEFDYARPHHAPPEHPRPIFHEDGRGGVARYAPETNRRGPVPPPPTSMQARHARGTPMTADSLAAEFTAYAGPGHVHASPWARDYLEREPGPSSSADWGETAAAVRARQSSAKTQQQQKENATEEEDAELKWTAAALSRMAEKDPKLHNSQFMSFVRDLGGVTKAEATVPDWSSEYAAQANEDPRAAYKWAEEFAARSLDGASSEDSRAKAWLDEFTRARDGFGVISGENEEIFGGESDWAAQFAKEVAGEGASSEATGLDDMRREWERLLSARKDEDDFAFGEASTSQSQAANEPPKSWDEYPFEVENPYADATDAFARGMELLSAGNLREAILAFEAEVKGNEGNWRAWLHLGIAQAENEWDSAAIAALRKCVGINPSAAEGQLALSVSYTNEGRSDLAYEALMGWMMSVEAYKSLAQGQVEGPVGYESEVADGFTPMPGRHAEVRNRLLAAARLSPSELDPDVQIALGVVFNISMEYDKAVDCFNAALNSRPDEYILWNRLGATLANGGRSEEAVSAYYRALELRPGFIRARYNLGVSCINLRAYNEAVEHLLTALSMQARADRPPADSMSDTIWGTLAMATAMMGRNSLSDAARAKNLEAFRSEF
eukprot:Opistho-2@88836